MNTLNFLDANVWMALLWGRHIHSDRARAWFDESAEEQFLFCRFTQITVLRLLTTEQIMGRDTATMAQAWSIWDQVSADPRMAYVAEPAGLGAEFRSRTQISSRSPKIWADAYLWSFAAVAGLKLVTFDRALKARGLDVLVL